MSDLIIGRAEFGPSTNAAQPRPTDLPVIVSTPQADAETRALLAELEKELGVKGTTAVFRKALALAKAARTDAEREFGPLGDW